MINDAVFAAEWTILEDRFQTRHNGETSARYLDALDAELDTEQFAQAAARCFRFDRFFPSPQDLIDHALGGFLEQAEDAWEAIMERYASSAQVYTDEGTMARAVLAKLGGSQKLRDASDYGFEKIHSGFLTKYARALREEAATKSGMALPAPAVTPKARQPTLEPEDAFLPLEGPRGKTVNFLQMARKAGVKVSLPTDMAAD